MSKLMSEEAFEIFKMKPHLYSKMLNDLRTTSVKFKDTQQLREQLSKTLSNYIVPDHKQEN